jgi:hypothetical protein
MIRKFKGLVALSHPRYNLYKPYYDPSEPDRKTIDDSAKNWNYLMDCIPRYFDCDTRVIEVAERHKLPFRTVYDYVKEFESKKLIEVVPSSLSCPPIRSIPPN